MKLAVFCDCEIGVIVCNVHNGKLFEYSSADMEQALNRYASYNGPSERRKREDLSGLSAAKGFSDIPQSEPNVERSSCSLASR
ncbi:Myocyte-specific enhancer factor 2D [Gracilariopsis chorda]|uniref:Myocyte-specific enhancer factor 2D n=1 Tax=Gracilariopsis chorda TaxID=448386 RepID=A0A2V3IQ43_9FLOR|nr:Myocyte-specific enhancer factor 2D [Gracilariopsis chorda]|eukprot:PXF44173.1 Myocyte-specific enhancer factor 2D [Gracilariopsis chorda]